VTGGPAPFCACDPRWPSLVVHTEDGDVAVEPAAKAFRARMDERQRQAAHSKDLDWAGLDETFRSPWTPHQDAIMQPPKPQIIPSATILQLASERDADHEAAD
jgi:hypothetical protein